MFSALRQQWFLSPIKEATTFTERYVKDVATSTDDIVRLIRESGSVMKEDRVCTLFGFVMNDVRLYKIITVAMVHTAIEQKWDQLLDMYASKALRDIMSVFIEASITIDEPTFTYAYAVVNVTMELELLTLHRVMTNVVKYIRSHMCAEVIHAAFGLFGELALYKGSAFDKLLLKDFEGQKRLDLAAVMKSCRDVLASSALLYTRVDFSPQLGSTWLRQLLMPDATLDDEEVSRGLTHHAAFVSRWYRFVRCKLATKRAILLEKVNGLNLMQFAIYMASTSEGGLGRLLLDLLVHLTAFEHKDMLPYDVNCEFVKSLKDHSFHFMYRFSQFCLEKQVVAVLDAEIPTFEHVIDVSRRGLEMEKVIDVLAAHNYKERNLTDWRVLLRLCLKYMYL